MKISLIIPIYNVELWLRECIESAINQTIPFDEIILINDGSTDNSGEICKKYEKEYSKIILIQQENRGLSAARNAGILRAKGDYVMFLDSDDLLAKDTVESISHILDKKDLDALYFDGKNFIDGIDKKKHEKDVRGLFDRKAGVPKTIMCGKDFFDAVYPRYYLPYGVLGVYKRMLLIKNNIQFPEKIYFEDVYFTFVFMNEAERVTYIPRILYHRRLRANSIMTSSFSDRKISDYIKAYTLVWEYIEKKWNTDVMNDKLLLYINKGYRLITLRFLECYTNNIHISENTIDLFQWFTKKYLSFLTLEFGSYETFAIESKIFALRNLLFIDRCSVFNTVECPYNIVMEMVTGLRKNYCKLLSMIPFQDKHCRIGIYGIGDHTKGMLDFYCKLIGEISAQIIFIDSAKDKGEYMGKAVINYKDIKDKFDLIVISSSLYDKVMSTNVKVVDEKVKVLRFYESISMDIFSNNEDILECVLGKTFY